MTRKPIGVVAAITPFNFPIAIPAWKIAPALVYGNTVVWKPASSVPLLAVRLAEALTSAGLPAGVLNLMIGNSVAGDALVNHADSRRHHLHRLDRGGHGGSPPRRRRAVCRSRPRWAVRTPRWSSTTPTSISLLEQVMLGAFRSTGQKCTATSRLVLTEGIADRFLEALSARADALAVGDPSDDATQMGPVISRSAQSDIVGGIDTAKAQGGIGTGRRRGLQRRPAGRRPLRGSDRSSS